MAVNNARFRLKLCFFICGAVAAAAAAKIESMKKKNSCFHMCGAACGDGCGCVAFFSTAPTASGRGNVRAKFSSTCFVAKTAVVCRTLDVIFCRR